MQRKLWRDVWIGVIAALLIAAGSGCAPTNKGLYRVGVAKTDITPAYPILLCGYAVRTKESEGIEQQLWAKALAVGGGSEPVSVLITVDNTAVPRSVVEEVAARLRKRAKITREHLTVCSSHTHTGPCLASGIPNMFGRDLTAGEQAHIEQYTRELTDSLEKVALAAIKDRKPARLAWGQGKAPFAANRRTKNGPVDHAVPLLRVTDPDGELRAVLVNYACHCTTLGPEMNKICGDWATYAQDNIEAENPGAIAMVSIGCGADANPEPRTGLKFAQQHGRTLSDEVSRLLKTDLTPLTGPLTCRLKKFELPFGPPPSREEFEKRAKQKGYAGYHASKNLARLDRGEKLESQLPYYVQTWTFGDQLGMVFLAGEVVVDYSLRIKKEFDPTRIWVSAYTNDVPCYIPSRRILSEGGYEAEGAMMFYDHPTRLAPVVEDLIIRAVHELLPDSFRTAEQKAEFPLPLSPADALRSFQLPDDLRIELVAAEPAIVDPVAIDWGPDGKLWVAEMHDYPTGIHEDDRRGAGRIKVIEDTNGDGRYDRATVFLDGLALPTGVLHWHKGVLYCAAPEIVYAEDTDGDGKADVKKVLCSGFSPENTQALVNSLAWGLDGWVHGANSIASKPIHIAMTGKTIDIGGRDFRMKPDTGEFEAAAGRAQYGRVRDDFGNWFGNENSDWLFHFPMPDRYVRRNLSVPVPGPRVNVSRDPQLDRIYPISRTLARYNEPTRANRVTSACSPALYRDNLLGRQYSGNVFVCEVVHNVVRRLILDPDDITFASHKPPDEQQSEFLASKDNWFRPAQVRTGPDGCLYVADMYRYVIEEPVWISAERLATLDIRAGDDRGRIYRIVPKGRLPRPVPKLTALDAPELARLLDNPNGTLRDIVHQELVHRGDRAAVPVLKEIAAESSLPAARIQALYALSELDALSPAELKVALASKAAPLRENAAVLAEPWLSKDKKLRDAVEHLADDGSIRVRYQAALSLGEANDPDIGDALARIALHDLKDPWIRAAVLTSASKSADRILARIITAPAGATRDEFVGRLIATASANGEKETLQAIVKAIAPAEGAEVEPWRLTAVASILDARDRADLSLNLSPLASTFESARSLIEAPDTKEPVRVAAIRLLGRSPDHRDEDMDCLATLLTPKSPAPIQAAAIAALGRLHEPKVADIILAGWPAASPTLRSSMLDVLLSRPESTSYLLEAIRHQQLMPAEIDAIHREQLFKHSDAEIREESARLLASVRPPSRKEALDRYKAALTFKGNQAPGAATFSKICATCHAFRGVGHSVGPNLAALTDRSTNYLFTAILDPNAAVDAKYTSYLVELSDGRSLSGIITEETASSLTVLQGNAVRDTVLRSDVNDLRSSNLSLMPEGLEEGLTPQQIADLIAYVQSGPTALGSSTPPQENHARRAFLNQGTSGLAKVLSATEVSQQPGWLGTMPMHFCRQMDGKWNVSWQTEPVPADFKSDAYQSFRLAVAMGFLSQPAGSFTLQLNRKPVLDFNVVLSDQDWNSSDGKVRMHYMAMQNNAEDSTGVLVIEVQAGLLKPGEPAIFTVVGSAAHSQRWFGVYDFHS